jgi:prepilin-type N-terminal cleavage/methylation domain-containing protein
MNKNDNKDQGFTLVELLIVIVILGILATVTVFAVRGITDQGQTSACSADKKTLQVAVEAYFAQYGGETIPITGGTAPSTDWTLGGTPAATIVASGLLVDVSTNYTVAAAGTLTPVAPCT